MSNHIMNRIVKVLAKNGYTSTEKTIRALLEEEFEDTIFTTWNINDVKTQAKRMEVELTEDQCYDVLNYLEENWDASIGICWDTIEMAILDSRE